MPLHRSSGGAPASVLLGGRTTTRTCWPRTTSVRDSSCSVFVHIGPRRRSAGREVGGAEVLRCSPHRSAPVGEPAGVVLPPAALHLVSGGEPLGRARGAGVRGLEAGLRVPRRVDHR